MRSLRRIPHLLALLVALAQGIVPAAAASADAALAAAARGERAGAHVERLGGVACQPVHTDSCHLCRLLSLDPRPALVVCALPVATALAVRAPAELAPRRATAGAGVALPRGPPAA